MRFPLDIQKVLQHHKAVCRSSSGARGWTFERLISREARASWPFGMRQAMSEIVQCTKHATTHMIVAKNRTPSKDTPR